MRKYLFGASLLVAGLFAIPANAQVPTAVGSGVQAPATAPVRTLDVASESATASTPETTGSSRRITPSRELESPTNSEPRAFRPIENNADSPPFAFESTPPRPIASDETAQIADAVPSQQTRVRSMPIVSAETTGPAELRLNKQALYNIKLDNLGDDIARDVTVEIELPVGASAVKTAPKCEVLPDGRLRFRIGQIEPKAEKNLAIHLTPTKRGDSQLRTTVQTSGTSSLATESREPKLKITAYGPGKAVYGEKLTYKLVVENTGDAPCRNVQLRAGMPKGLKPQVSSSGDTISELGVGESKELFVVCNSETTGELTLSFQVASDCGVQATTHTRLNISRPLVEVTTQGPAVAYLKRDCVYSILITNGGDGPADDVRVKVNLPKGMRVVALDREAKFDSEANTLTWALKQIPKSGIETFRFKSIGEEEGAQVHDVEVTASAGVRTLSRHTTEVVSRADVSMQIADTAGPIEVGESSIFEVLVRNRGSKEAQNVTVNVELPDELGAVRSTTYRAVGQQIAFPVQSLKPGEKKIFRFEAIGNASGDHIVKVRLRADALDNEITAEESVFYYKSQTSRSATLPVEIPR